jgi:hypothetical protein
MPKVLAGMPGALKKTKIPPLSKGDLGGFKNQPVDELMQML